VVTFWGIHPHPSQEAKTIHHFEVQEYGADGTMPLTIFIDEVAINGAVNRQTIRVIRHYVGPEECIQEVRSAGFREIRIFGSFHGHEFGDPAVAGSGRLVCECSN
jgi:hypothetical protein